MTREEERDKNKNIAMFALFLGIISLALSIFALYRTGVSIDETVRVEVDRALNEAQQGIEAAGRQAQPATEEIRETVQDAAENAAQGAEEVIPDDVDVQIYED